MPTFDFYRFNHPFSLIKQLNLSQRESQLFHMIDMTYIPGDSTYMFNNFELFVYSLMITTIRENWSFPQNRDEAYPALS